MAAVLFVSSSCIVVAHAEPPGWKLAWQDDFNTLDESVWTLVDTNDPTNDSLQDYLPEQVSVSKGKLVIASQDIPSRGLPYRSGQVVSKSEQRLGRWEIRAKLPTGQGMWPAIWLLPEVTAYPWPGGGEIDIMENRGDQPNGTSCAFHFGTREPYFHDFVYSQQQTRVLSGALVDYHRTFHTYAVEWYETHLNFYVDDVHYYTVHDEDVDGYLSQHTAPMQLVLNTAIGGTFLQNPDPTSTWPDTHLEVDWVRVYEPKPGTFHAVHKNGSFEANNGSLSAWSVFGNELIQSPNVGISAQVALDGIASLKLYGTFESEPSYSGVMQGISVEGGQEVAATLKAFVRSQDSIADTDNSATLKIEFYSRFGAKYGSAQMLDIATMTFADGDVQEDAWLDASLKAVAPAGAVEARLAIVFSQPTQAAGAVHVDDVRFGVVKKAAVLDGFNGARVVHAANDVAWRKSSQGMSGIIDTRD